MKAQPPDRPNQPGKRPKGEPVAGPVKPKRTKERGPLGFGSVMRDVGGKKGQGTGGQPRPDGERGALIDGAHRHGMAAVPQVGGSSGPVGAPVDAGLLAAAKMGEVLSATELDAEQVRGPESAVEALAAEDRSATAQLQRGEAGIPTRLGRLTPNAVLGVVVDEATKLAIEEASKELHVELEPEDLGPLIVTLRRDKGRLSVHFRARQSDAARVLDAGLGLLEERLRQRETGSIETSVEHDPDVVLGQA